MDSLVTAAARALEAGDVLGALKRVSLRDDPPALALRGIAMARLGELERARALLRQAARAFGDKEPLSRARCATAEAEVALAMRDFKGSDHALLAARDLFEARGDRINALHARLVQVRKLLLLGRFDAAEDVIRGLVLDGAPPTLVAIAELLQADLLARKLRAEEARASLRRAEAAAARAQIPELAAEVSMANKALSLPVARRVGGSGHALLRLADVEALLQSPAFVVDGCRYGVHSAIGRLSFARRPALFALLCALAEAWPSDVAREALIEKVFDARRANESHRARLRVDMGRLRQALRSPKTLANIVATGRGYALELPADAELVVLARPFDDENAALLALLADGNAWSSSALALALGASQRSVQRALLAFERARKVTAFGQGRARKWSAPPIVEFATTLLLPGPLPVD